MNDYQENDVVRLLRDMPQFGLRAGDQGTIIYVWKEPKRAYEVEFSDALGKPYAQVTLIPNDVERVWKWNAQGDNPGPRSC